jgi:hypothetical protein
MVILASLSYHHTTSAIPSINPQTIISSSNNSVQSNPVANHSTARTTTIIIVEWLPKEYPCQLMMDYHWLEFEMSFY